MKFLFFISIFYITLVCSDCFANNVFQSNQNGATINKISNQMLENYDELILFHLMSFSVQIHGNKNVIKWEMIQEDNNDFFTIEKSTDGIFYETVTIIKGAGNTTSKGSYSTDDVNFKNEINYYRIKITDFDGESRVSDIISVDNRLPKSKEIFTKLDLKGQEVNEFYNGLVIIRYSDGSTKKVVQ